MENKIIGITGTSGFVGSFLKAYFLEQQFTVIELNRKNTKYSINLRSSTFENELLNLPYLDFLIHCSWDLSTKNLDESLIINVKNTEKLFTHFINRRIKKIIFLSSMSASENTPSVYGYSKYLIEKLYLNNSNVILIKPGLIYHENVRNGLLYKIGHNIKTKSIIPLIDGGKQIQYTTHLEDLALQIKNFLFITENKQNNLFYILDPTNRTFFQILRILKKGSFISLHVPWYIVWVVLKFFEIINFKIGLKSESVIGLVNSNSIPNNLSDQHIIKSRNFEEFKFWNKT